MKSDLTFDYDYDYDCYLACEESCDSEAGDECVRKATLVTRH